MTQEGDCSKCKKCEAWKKMQKKYIDQIKDLFDDFHLTISPLLNEEVWGKDWLELFGGIIFDQVIPEDE